MADAVEETVYFKLTVQSIEHGGHWTTTALETGVITAGATRHEAEGKSGASSRKGSRRLMRSWPRAGSTTSLASRLAESLH